MPGPRNRPRKVKKKPPRKPTFVSENLPEAPQTDGGLLQIVPSPGLASNQAPTSKRHTYLNPSGNGPQLSGVREFIQSSYASPPSLSDPECAVFAREDVFRVLCLFLPEELALTVWYNKTRKTARICAACRRFYNLGDSLPSLSPSSADIEDQYDGPQLELERRISGLCSFACFGISSYNTPGAGPAWGKLQAEIDSDTMWRINNTPPIVDDEGLGALFKLTRRSDVGIGHYVDLVRAKVEGL